MNRPFRKLWFPTLATLFVVCLLTACTTRPKIDWSGRIGGYSYDQAVMDYGPPDKTAELSDNSIVAEWLTQRGDYRVDSFGYGYGHYGYHGRPYHPYGFYPGHAVGPYGVSRTPDRYLRLIFDPEGMLKGHSEFSK
jgi:hypothetical protein